MMILYLYKKSKGPGYHGNADVRSEGEITFSTSVISIKYDVPNDKPGNV